MAGFVKSKKYDWKDSNMSLFGSDTERQVKKTSAETELAWKNAGSKPGLQIWRIVKFKVTNWPKEEYGKFYDGDSYIILNTYVEEGTEELLYDVHFWIGQYSTQDEYGTAAYKTVELDTFLDDAPIQHREVQGHESSMFRSYFKSITYLHGGADSGFRRVQAEVYRPRLLHFHGTRPVITVTEVPRSRSKLDSTDVYILDLGLVIYQWNGKGCNKDEKFKAITYLQDMKSERGKAKSEVLDEDGLEETHEFYRNLNADTEDSDFGDSDSDIPPQTVKNQLFRLSDASGSIKFALEKEKGIGMSDFDSKDVFIFDTCKELFVWVGKATSKAEKKNAIAYAHKYLMKSAHPLIPISCLKEGQRNKSFTQALAA